MLLLNACVAMAAASSRRLFVLAHYIPLYRYYHDSPRSLSLPFTRRQRSDSRAPALTGLGGCGSVAANGVKKTGGCCGSVAADGVKKTGGYCSRVASKEVKKKTDADYLKWRTRSGEAFDRDQYKRHADPASGHVSVLLGEVLQAFRSAPSWYVRAFRSARLDN